MCYHYSWSKYANTLTGADAARLPLGLIRLNREAAAKVAAALAHASSRAICPTPRALGAGVYEYRIDFGPGYRIYFGKDGERLVILVGGGTKKRQQEDINTALARWQDYKQRKGTGR